MFGFDYRLQVGQDSVGQGLSGSVQEVCQRVNECEISISKMAATIT
jgi:hypothetical protein